MLEHYSNRQPRDKKGRFRPGRVVAVGAPPVHAPKPHRNPYKTS